LAGEVAVRPPPEQGRTDDGKGNRYPSVHGSQTTTPPFGGARVSFNMGLVWHCKIVELVEFLNNLRHFVTDLLRGQIVWHLVDDFCADRRLRLMTVRFPTSNDNLMRHS
jgi:hypothetical protein